MKTAWLLSLQSIVIVLIVFLGICKKKEVKRLNIAISGVFDLLFQKRGDETIKTITPLQKRRAKVRLT